MTDIDATGGARTLSKVPDLLRPRFLDKSQHVYRVTAATSRGYTAAQELEMTIQNLEAQQGQVK